MKQTESQWDRLVQTARTAPPRPLPEAPFGFATRVVARWAEQQMPSLFNLWKLLSLRVLAFGCLVMVASLGASYGVIREELARPQADLTVQVFEAAGVQLEEVLLP